MLPHLRSCRFHFLVKLPGGHPQNAASEGGQLDQSVGGRHPHGVVPADLVGQRFNVSIGGLALFGVDHLNVVELALFAGVALLLVAVEYHHQTALCEARVAGKPVTQLPPGGVQIVLEEGITPGAVDYGAVIQKIRKAGADGIIFGGYHPEASKLVQQLAKKKIDIPFIGPDGVKDEQFIKVAGKNAEGVYATGPTDVSKLPMNIQAHENHKKKYGTEPGAFYDNAYSATVALLEAIKAAGSTDSQKIMEALRTNMVDTPLGKIKFDAKGDAEGIGFSIYEVKDGKFVELK